MKRSRLKPVSFKATLIGKSGKKNIKEFNLTSTKKSKFPRLESRLNEDVPTTNSAGVLRLDNNETPLNMGLTSYEKRQLSLNQKWTDIRESVLQSFAKECYMPKDQECVICKTNEAVLKCEHCGPRQYFCRACGHSLHERRNQFHVLELWKGRTFVPYFIEGCVLHTHTCLSADTRSIICVDEHGNHHSKKVAFCNCEPAAITLVRHCLWPATPERPSTAFSFKLMDLVESVFLHCKVSLKEFTECLESLRKPLNPRLVSSIYQLLNANCFEEYRFFKNHLSTLEMFFPELDNGAMCPLCPKENGILIESMDACFGLNRKKRQGINSFTLPKRGTLMFADQDDVDNYVDSYSEKADDVSKDCSRFHAGEVTVSLRSKGKNKLFDEKGIFGRVCRHDFPKGFHNIKYGERIAYPLYEMKRFKEEHADSKDLKLVMMYDIACILDKHIEKNIGRTNFARDVTLAIPIFHCYGHKASCQFKYSPRRVEGIGLTDGEGTERLWAFLRDYSRITKEMSPVKRVDVLTDGLLHYARRLRQRFGPVLKMKLKRTQKLLNQTNSDLSDLCKSMSVTCTDELIGGWIQEELLSFQPNEKELLWDEQYITYIRAITKFRQIIALNDVTVTKEDVSLVRKKLERTERLAKTIETTHGIKDRWNLTSNVAEKALQRLIGKTRANLLLQIHRLSSERVFLLEMKKKYADGQGIAIKLSKEITKVVKNINSLLELMNNKENQSINDKEVTFEDIKDPKSTVYACVDGGETSCSTSIPTSTKSKAIHLHCLKKRCEEEVDLLTTELSRFVSFLEGQIVKIDERDISLQSLTEGRENGYESLLLSKRAALIQELAGLQHLWSHELVFKHDYEDILNKTLNGSQEVGFFLLEEDVSNFDLCDDVNDDDVDSETDSFD